MNDQLLCGLKHNLICVTYTPFTVRLCRSRRFSYNRNMSFHAGFLVTQQHVIMSLLRLFPPKGTFFSSELEDSVWRGPPCRPPALKRAATCDDTRRGRSNTSTNQQSTFIHLQFHGSLRWILKEEIIQTFKRFWLCGPTHPFSTFFTLKQALSVPFYSLNHFHSKLVSSVTDKRQTLQERCLVFLVSSSSPWTFVASEEVNSSVSQEHTNIYTFPHVTSLKMFLHQTLDSLPLRGSTCLHPPRLQKNSCVHHLAVCSVGRWRPWDGLRAPVKAKHREHVLALVLALVLLA